MTNEVADAETPAKLFQTEQWKAVVLALPLTGAIVAVAFDVGYFSGVDINYFTVFSLSEHIGFALEALPIAFSATALSLVLLMFLSKARTTAVKGRLNSAFIIFDIVSIITGAMTWWFKGLRLALWLVVVIVLFVTIRSLGVRIIFLAAATGIAMLGAVFFAGYDIANGYVNGHISLHILNDEQKGRLIRSGERGILFVTSDNNQIVLFRWDGIKSIKTIR
jgi:hypothetical protein